MPPTVDDPRERIAREPMHRGQVLAVAIATALNALDGFDVLSISFASPGIAAQWGIDRAALGVVLSMELVGMAFGAFLLGALADRAGRRPTILACLGLMTLGMAAAAGATGVVALSAFRLLTGLGIGGMLAATNAVAAECSNARRRSLAVAVMAGGYPMGAIVGGIAASALLAGTGRWQSIFLFGAAATVLFVPLVVRFVPETVAFLCHRQPRGALDAVNRTLARQGRDPIAALPPLPDARARASLAEALAPGMVRTTLLLIAAYFSHIMTFYFFMKWTPKVVADLGFAPSAAAGVRVWANVGGAAGSVALSLLTQRLDLRWLVAGAMLCGSAAVAGFGQVHAALGTLCAVAAAAGFVTNGATAGLYAVFARSFPTRLRAGGTGLVIGIGRGGAALGPVIAGLLFAAGWPLARVAPTMACGGLVGALALLLIGGRSAIAPERAA
jgi:benzoate transport